MPKLEPMLLHKEEMLLKLLPMLEPKLVLMLPHGEVKLELELPHGEVDSETMLPLVPTPLPALELMELSTLELD